MDSVGSSVTTWGQLAFFAVASAVGIVFAVSHLFKTMTNAYGGIIAALQVQNAGQQAQLDTNRNEIAVLKREHEDCERHYKETKAELDALNNDVQEVKKKVNGH